MWLKGVRSFLVAILACGSFCAGIRHDEAARSATFCVNSTGSRVYEPRGRQMTKLLAKAPDETIPVYAFIHTHVEEGLNLVLSDILMSMEQSGLYADATRVTVAVVGAGIDRVESLVHSFGSRFSKVKAVQSHQDKLTWELGTINHLRAFAQRVLKRQNNKAKGAHLLYVNTKGMFKEHGDYVAKWFWRKLLGHWVIGHHREARQLLIWGYDAVGSNAVNQDVAEFSAKMRVNPRHAWHYSGNWWWATAHHVARLPKLDIDREIDQVDRCQAENLVLSLLPDMCAGLLHQSASTHVYDLQSLPSLRGIDEAAVLGTLVSGSR